MGNSYLYTSAVALTMLLAACGEPNASTTGAPSAAAGAASADGTAGGRETTTTHAASTSLSAAGRASPSLAGSVPPTGGRELVNPDPNTMVFLYYQLAHLPLPLETWVEDDSRVRFAPAPERAPHRAAVRSELESAAAAVKGVGAIRLTMNANLSDYDPTYGEFTVRALAPSSIVPFNALGQKVSMTFTNGQTAQIWRVPPADAQAVRDKIGYSGNVDIDVLSRITGVLPGPGGGTITTEVLEYEMRQTRSGAVIGRVRIGK